MTECHEMTNVMDIVSAKITSTIATIDTSTSSINCHSKKRDCYILHTVLLKIILLSIIVIICYYYVKQKKVLMH